MIRITPHPEWVNDFLSFVRPHEERVVNSRIFNDIYTGELSIKQFHGALTNFYPLIESFPQYMALNLAKVPSGSSKWDRRTRNWLITNISQERLHTDWWKHFAVGFGVPKDVLDKIIYPPPEIDAINHYLWHICSHGSLAEGISASNYAVEGPTGVWTKNIKEGFQKYRDVEGVVINDQTLEWVEAHANYDDHHPVEALEIIKAYATTEEEQEKVKQAAKRALEYYALALEACYNLFRK